MIYSLRFHFAMLAFDTFNCYRREEVSRASSCLYTEIGRLNPVIKRAGRRGAEGSVFIDVAGNGGLCTAAESVNLTDASQ